MPIYQKEFPLSVRPWRTPFGTPGEPSDPVWFLYLTNREQRFTGLFPPSEGWKEAAERCFPPGYTQLWLLEKRIAFHPRPGSKRRAPRRSPLLPDPPVPYPSSEELPRERWPNRLFVVLREPYPKGAHHDVVGAWASEEAAREAAERYTRDHNRRSVVGLLLADLGWH
ncbi:MAG: hypothetical protein GXP50_10975 [Deltaproteobacteria bacterium]|nr:hypothetical protein [Deltaproteobacteria bacterium]